MMAGGLLAGSIFGQQPEPAKVSPTRDLDNPFAAAMERGRESDNPLARQQWFMHGRTVEHGSSSEYLLRAYEQKMWQRAVRRMQSQTLGTLSPNALPAPTWNNLGPAPLNSDWTGFGFQDYGVVGGRVTAVTMDQADATGNTVYIASAFGGVWKTANGAAAVSSVVWTPVMDDQATLAVNAISIQPGNSNTILIGTGEPNNAIDSYYGLGVLRSTDGGLHWTLINTTAEGASLRPSLTSSGLGFTKFAWAAPDNSNLVVAGLSSGDHAGRTPLLGDTDYGAIYSTDAGATWHKASFTGATANRVSDVVYNPTAKKFFAVMKGNGVFSSSDGATWTKLAAQPGTSISSLYRGQLAMHPTKNEMYIWYVNSSTTDLGIYQTLDGGNTWNTISTSDMDNCSGGDACGTTQGFYNLYLAAIPNGSGTDLYAGAVNLFKCQITSTNPDCSKNAAGSNWLNLTHVYSCNPVSAMAHVHPDQHGIDFLRTNPSIIYFGNDGGVYRTLNGPGLNNGTCSGTPNPFDNLNGTLGSTLQFYSLAGHPTDPTSFVGGTQDNGTPGVDSAHAGSNGVTWSEVNGGDGGAVAIDPTNGNNWYVSNTTSPGPNIALFFSSSGVTSRGTQFGNGSPYLTSTQLGGDAGDWVTPFKLDPADPTKIVIGTCRVWRGPASTAAGWTSGNAISNNFAAGSASTCSSSSNSIIRSLAVGGPKTSNGSQVIYAGSELGHVFATTSADAGPSSWTDVSVSSLGTCGGYPCGYPISGIAIDPSDSTGKTAYASVMGFGFPHVYKTTNGGGSWTNITGGLVDAPANAVAVDPGNPAIVYVGTDVGVFATQDGGATWAEYGTLLPNSAVIALDTFNSSSTHLLRAATHGRGVWSTTLASAATTTTPGTVTASPSFLTFLNQPVGATSAAQTVTVTVSGAPVVMGSFSRTNKDFVTVSDSCSGATLQVGATCAFSVAFAPTIAGGQTGSIAGSYTSNGTTVQISFSLQGNGVVATGSSVTPENGWWWDSKLNGTGFFLEYRAPSAQNSTPGIFIGGFLYDASGNSTWLITLGSINGSFTSNSSGLTYTGKWIRCSGGQALTAVWKQNSCNLSYADVTIVFPDSKHATMTRPDGTQIQLTRFSFTSSATPVAPEPGTPQNGWWWIDPASPTYNFNSLGGTGYGIEIQGNAVFIVAYVYDGTSGNPIWDLAYSGSTPIQSATNFSQTWNVFSGGPQLTSPEGNYTANPVSGTSVPVTFNFTDATHGTMTMGSVVIPITKFGNF